jgi:hypothetical protein
MSEVDDLASSYFDSASDDERLEQFDVSTAKLVLKQLGIPPEKIKYVEYEFGPAFGLQWVAESIPLEIDLWSTRSFKYDIGQLLTAPYKSPIVKSYLEHIEENPSDLPRYMVFRAYDIGRLVAMSEPPKDRAYIHVLIGDPCLYITTFNHLFSNNFGSECEL